MTEQTRELKQNLIDLLTSSKSSPGLLIAWAQGCLSQLKAAHDVSLQAFAEGVEAWLVDDYATAALAWQTCQANGLSGLVLEALLKLARPALATTVPKVVVYVDGSFAHYQGTGGVACAWKRDGRYGILASYLPGPLPDNHCAEAAALRLALTASELADCSLILYTDSQTVIRALEEPTAVRLPQKTRDMVSEVSRLCDERGAVVRHHLASTGKLLHDRADHMASWVRVISRSNLEEKGVNHESS